MRLRPRVDSSGALWFDNYVVTFLRWSENWYNPPRHRLLSSRGILYLLLALAYWALTAFEWVYFPSTSNVVAWFLAVTSVVLTVYAYHRHRRPLFHPDAPVRVGVTPAEILWQGQDGRIGRRLWSSIADVRIERDEVSGLTLRLVGGEAVALRSLYLDLAIKLRWAFRLFARGELNVDTLATPSKPTRLPLPLPPGWTEVPSVPSLFLFPDRLVVLSRTVRLWEYPRSDVDAFVYPEYGDTWLVVTAGDRYISRVSLPHAVPLLDWIHEAVTGGAGSAETGILK